MGGPPGGGEAAGGGEGGVGIPFDIGLPTFTSLADGFSKISCWICSAVMRVNFFLTVSLFSSHHHFTNPVLTVSASLSAP